MKFYNLNIKKKDIQSFNLGLDNEGIGNSGKLNIGNFNCGDNNIGDYNSSNSNVGDYNSGMFNVGNCNNGYCNTGNFHNGFFNTGEANIRLFNKDTNFKFRHIRIPRWLFNIELTFKHKNNLKRREYKKAFKMAFKRALKYEIKDTLNLPNFDYKIFEEITGITKEMIKNKLKNKR